MGLLNIITLIICSRGGKYSHSSYRIFYWQSWESAWSKCKQEYPLWKSISLNVKAPSDTYLARCFGSFQLWLRI